MASEKLITYFTGLGARHGACAAGVGWSAASQRARFEVLAGIGALDGASILDVGCGYGAFLDFLREHAVDCDYQGVDMTPLQIDLAIREHPGSAGRFRVANVLEGPPADPPPASFDYVIANGPLNAACDDPLATMRALMEVMYRLCRIACGVTMISTRAPERLDHLHYYDPLDILAHALEISPRVKLDHTYLPHDFAIICFKPPRPGA